MKERLMALFVGLVMIGSIAGFAAVQFIPEQQAGGVEIPTVVDKFLTSEEIVYILRTGRVLIQNHYPSNCTECMVNNALLETFAHRMEGFVVLEEVKVNETNQTKLQIIGPDGRIKDLESANMTDEGLIDIFCDISYVQPKECLLKEI